MPKLKSLDVVKIRWEAYHGNDLNWNHDATYDENKRSIDRQVASKYWLRTEQVQAIVRGKIYIDVKEGPVLNAHYIVPGGHLLNRPISPVLAYEPLGHGLRSSYHAHIDWLPGKEPTSDDHKPLSWRRGKQSVYGPGNKWYSGVNTEVIRRLRWQYWAGEISGEEIPIGGDCFIHGYGKDPFGVGEDLMKQRFLLYNLSGASHPGHEIGGPVMGIHYENPGDPLDFNAFTEGESFADYQNGRVYWDIGIVPPKYQNLAQRPDGLLDNICGGRGPNQYTRIPGMSEKLS